MRNAFHVSLHARPPGNWPERPRPIGDDLVRELMIPSSELERPLGISFEQATDALLRLPRIFVEPDGSFVWAIEDPVWGRGQIDGSLLDRGASLQYVELKGSCTAAAFEALLTIFRSDGGRLIVQLLQHAVLLDEEEFKLLAFGAPRDN